MFVVCLRLCVRAALTAGSALCRLLAKSNRLTTTRNAVWALSNLCRGKNPPPDFAKVSPVIVVESLNTGAHSPSSSLKLYFLYWSCGSNIKLSPCLCYFVRCLLVSTFCPGCCSAVIQMCWPMRVGLSPTCLTAPMKRSRRSSTPGSAAGSLSCSCTTLTYSLVVVVVVFCTFVEHKWKLLPKCKSWLCCDKLWVFHVAVKQFQPPVLCRIEGLLSQNVTLDWI